MWSHDVLNPILSVLEIMAIMLLSKQDYSVFITLVIRVWFTIELDIFAGDKVKLSGCSRLMANGDYWGLMGILLTSINH